MEDKKKKKKREKKKKKKKPYINNARYLICQNELKGKNVNNTSSFSHCSCQSE